MLTEDENPVDMIARFVVYNPMIGRGIGAVADSGRSGSGLLTVRMIKEGGRAVSPGYAMFIV